MGRVKGTKAQVKESFINQPARGICLDKPLTPSGTEGPHIRRRFHVKNGCWCERKRNGGRKREIEYKCAWAFNPISLYSFVLILEVSFHF